MEETIKTYATKGFKHEGVTGSEKDMRLNDSVSGITTDVMHQTGKGMATNSVEKIVHSPVKVKKA